MPKPHSEIRRRLRLLPFVVLLALGAVGGYLYYRLVGCVSGTCPISSNPWISTAYGAVMGGLLGSVFTPSKKGSKEAVSDE